MAEKYACKQCGFVFDDPDMKVCPKCGTELGKEWAPDELFDVLITDSAKADGAKLVQVIADISQRPPQEVGAMLNHLPALVVSGVTPVQAAQYLEKIRATTAFAIVESPHDRSMRLAAEANAKAKAEERATAEAKANADKVKYIGFGCLLLILIPIIVAVIILCAL